MSLSKKIVNNLSEIIPLLLIILSILMIKTLDNTFTINSTNYQSVNYSIAKGYSVDSIVWSDDFEDGNYEGWTVLDGLFSSSSTELLATGNDTDYHRIRHDSDISYGTWSFDVKINRSAYIPQTSINICFLMESYEQLKTDPKNKGYRLAIAADARSQVGEGGSNFFLEGIEGSQVVSLFGQFGVPSEILGTNQHIHITRSSNGILNVFANDTLIIEMNETLMLEENDNEVINGNYFGFDTYGGQGLDNITVDNEITIEPKATDQSKLQFTDESIVKVIEKETTDKVTVVVKNEGYATGYGTLVIGAVPNGITIDLIPSDFIKWLRANETKDRTLSINTDASVKPGVYNITLELRKSSNVLDSLILSIEITSSGQISYPILLWSVIIPLNLLMVIRRRWKRSKSQ